MIPIVDFSFAHSILVPFGVCSLLLLTALFVLRLVPPFFFFNFFP